MLYEWIGVLVRSQNIVNRRYNIIARESAMGHRVKSWGEGNKAYSVSPLSRVEGMVPIPLSGDTRASIGADEDRNRKGGWKYERHRRERNNQQVGDEPRRQGWQDKGTAADCENRPTPGCWLDRLHHLIQSCKGGVLVAFWANVGKAALAGAGIFARGGGKGHRYRMGWVCALLVCSRNGTSAGNGPGL